MSSEVRLPEPVWTERGRGRPLVLVHGFGAHGYCWEPWLSTLEARYRVLNVDLGGFGRAGAPRDASYDPISHARSLHRGFVERDLQGAVLIGHSLGGGIALALALRLLDEDPGRLGGLVSVAGAAYHVDPEPPFVRLARWPTLSRMALGLAPKRRLIRAVMSSIVVQQSAVTEERVRRYAEPFYDPARRRAMVACARDIVPPELERLTDRFGELDVPALCLWGRQDPVIPVGYGERLARSLPRAELVLLDQCGHLPVEEHPQASLAALLAFLERAVSPPR